jgi:hypothetical protein
MARIATQLALAVIAAQVSLAQASPSYDLTGTLSDGVPVRGSVAVRMDRGVPVLDARLDATGVPPLLMVRGEKLPDGSVRFKLPGTPGLRGALARDGSGKAPRYIYLRRNADGTVSGGGLAEDGTTALGALRGTRAAPAPTATAPDKAPPAVCEPPVGRYAAVLNGGVAGRETGRALKTFAHALWDFFKPGSPAFEGVRSDITKDQTTQLAQNLARNRTPPFTPDMIYAEARAVAKTPGEALRLAFALFPDGHGHSMALAPLAGIDEDQHGVDKYEHFFVSAIMAERGNATGSFTVGWLKEVMDGLPGGTGYDEDDLMADALGADFGQRLRCGDVDVAPIRRAPGR